MIVYCPKCKSEYNAGAEYFGKSFRCGCGEIVFVEAPQSSSQNVPPQKPNPTSATIQTQKQTVKPSTSPKPAANPEAKKAPATVSSSKKEVREKEQGLSEDKKEQTPTDKPTASEGEKKTRKTFYEVLIKVVCVVGILTEIANFLVCFEIAGSLAEQVPVELNALPILVFIAIWCVCSVFLFLFFAAFAALFRLADVACRSAGIRPLLF